MFPPSQATQSPSISGSSILPDRIGPILRMPGFVSAVDDTHLDIRIGAVLGAGVADGLAAGAPLGVLGLEAHTRRRNRVNGEIVEAAGDGLRVRVSQSFGNCPKYIHPRRAEWAPGADQPCRHTGWDDAARRIVAAADTFFIASAHPAAGDSRDATHGVDISHRGGEAGFVTVAGETLSVPDYPGNRFFNTLGNLELNPWASLLFIDFTTRETLQLAVRARIEWHPVAAGCRLDFEVLGAERSVGGLPLIWSG